jgi:peptidoglycan/xylan/chitin deacetylase (PgdA/CDA1 family)
MKVILQKLIRRTHVALCCQALPEKLAIYFHSISQTELGAFMETISYFLDRGYEFCDATAFCRRQSGRAVFLSFDDNHRSWIEIAEALQRYGVSATFYVNTCVLQTRRAAAEVAAYYDRIESYQDQTPLAATDVATLVAAGHILGSHGHSHHLLTRLPLPQAKEEIRQGKAELEDLLGMPVLHFSFPYGMRRHFCEELRSYCFELGFQTVASAIPAMQHCRQTPACIYRSPWRLPKSLEYNLDNLRVDGALFEHLTGRSAVG